LITKIFTLPSPTLIVFYINLVEKSVDAQKIRAKLTLSEVNYWIYRGDSSGNVNGKLEDHGVILYLPSGSYILTVEGYTTNTSYPVEVKNLTVGQLSFSDFTAVALQRYSSQLQISLPVRKTCVGALKNAMLIVNCGGATSAAVTNFQNPGESLTNYVTISVDGVQQSWTFRNNDSGAGNPSWALLCMPVAAGQTHAITISKGNANTVVSISVVLCPWILGPIDLEPLTLSFPQGSTFYITLEPLLKNAAKTVSIGKKRVISFGDSTDYYYKASGADILSANYTFESVEVSKCTLFASGFGGCISIIAVDVRG
jgi:hypothetical protein